MKEVNCIVLTYFDLCCYVRFYKESLPIISVRHHSYDPDGKTTIEMLNKNLEVLMIDSYSQVTAYCNHIEQYIMIFLSNSSTKLVVLCR